MHMGHRQNRSTGAVIFNLHLENVLEREEKTPWTRLAAFRREDEFTCDRGICRQLRGLAKVPLFSVINQWIES